jgi:hypothetical protein
MKKLRLVLDELSVETFATDGGEAPRGTVVGHATNTCITYRCLNTRLCTGAGGNAASCDGTCYATCGDRDCASMAILYCQTYDGCPSIYPYDCQTGAFC